MTTEHEESMAPEVSPADLQAAWAALQEPRVHGKPGEATSIDIRRLRGVYSPDANAESLWTRTLILQILNHVQPGWMQRQDITKIFEVAARFPVKLMQPGVEHNGPPFDVREFVKQIAAR
jgi:hypothetical protein